MKLKSAQSGDFNVKITEDISAMQIVSANKVTGGTVKITKFGAGGKREDMVDTIPLLVLAEISNHGLIINQTSTGQGTDFTFQLSESGNIAVRGEEYIMAEFQGVTLDAGSLDVYGVEEYMTVSGHNRVEEVLVLAGMKSRNTPVLGVDEIALPVDDALDSVEFQRGAKNITLTQAEIKSQSRRYRPVAFYQQNTTNNYGYKEVYLLPLEGVESVKVHTDGSKTLSVYLNTFG